MVSLYFKLSYSDQSLHCKSLFYKGFFEWEYYVRYLINSQKFYEVSTIAFLFHRWDYWGLERLINFLKRTPFVHLWIWGLNSPRFTRDSSLNLLVVCSRHLINQGQQRLDPILFCYLSSLPLAPPSPSLY